MLYEDSLIIKIYSMTYNLNHNHSSDGCYLTQNIKGGEEDGVYV